MSASAATAVNSDLCLRSQRTGLNVLLTSRRARLPISMPSPPSEPCEPPKQQRGDADADRVQRKELNVSGQRQRPDQQRRNDDRYRNPLSTHYESEGYSDDRSDPFSNVHVCTSLLCCDPRAASEAQGTLCCLDVCAVPLDGCQRTGLHGKCADRDGGVTGRREGKRTQFGLVRGNAREPRRGKCEST